MGYRKRLYIYISVTIVAFISSVVLGLSEKFGICPSASSYVCINKAELWAEPLFFGSLSLFIILLILLFTKEAVWNAWKKFGIWYIPLTAFLIFIAPSSSGGSFGYSMGFDREAVTMFLSAIFLVISLLIIAIKSWKLRG